MVTSKSADTKVSNSFSNRYVEVKLEGYDHAWTSGRDVIDVTLTIGQDDKGNPVTVILADSDGSIADKLVAHSLRTGGIQPLESETPTTDNDITAIAPEAFNGDSDEVVLTDSNPKTPEEWEQAIVRGCIAYGLRDPNAIAYILATAWKETSMGADLVNESAIFEGNKELGNTTPGDGRKYLPRGLVQATGKGNYAKLSALLKVDFLKHPELLTQAKYAIPAAIVGMQRGIFTGRSLKDYFAGGKTDWYNARRIINGTESAALIASKAQEVYLPIVKKLLPMVGSSTVNLKDKTQVASKVPSSTDVTGNSNEVLKGNKLAVSIDGYTYEFFHQSTVHNSNGTTTVTGQGVRWVLNRRKRNKTDKDISLSTLVKKIAKAHGIRYSYEADLDFLYTHIDQTNISDYQLLRRECDRVGLFLSEDKGVLKVRSLRSLQDTAFIAELRTNLISYSIEDKAIDSYQDDNSSSLLQSDPKVELNPITGQFEQLRVDVDKVRDTASTGKDKPKVGATLQPGQEALASANRARTKRVKGLPSTFVVPLSNDSLAIAPLNTLRTRNLPKTFNRVWLVDTVSHSLTAGTTTLSCYSPVEVISASPDTAPLVSPSVAPTTVAPTTNVAPGRYIWACKGIVTSPYGMRRHPISGVNKLHAGTDISCPTGTPVYAGKDGVVTKVAYQAKGAGYHITINHPDGFSTSYMHLSVQQVTVGQKVTQGQQIALSGNTGGSTGPHLHYQFAKTGGSSVPPSVVGLSVRKGQTVSPSGN